MTTAKDVCDPVDASCHKAKPAEPNTPTWLADASRHLDLVQCMASTRDLEVGALSGVEAAADPPLPP